MNASAPRAAVRGLARELLELVAPSVCPACDTPRRPGQSLLCAPCRDGLKEMRALGAVRTGVAYEGVGRRLVRRFKFDGRGDALAVLLPYLLDRVEPLPAQAVVGVPRHRRRVRETGADPVHDLARRVARARGLPHWRAALVRSRPTPTQSGLSPAERRRNVAGAFSAGHPGLAGARVLLLDDVATTGATLAEAAAALRAAGARRVWLAALAGTP